MKPLFVVGILLFLCKLGYVQSITLTGHIKNLKDSSDFEYATISLLCDSIQVLKVQADSNGHFLLKDIIPGNYKLNIYSIGYWDKVMNLEINQRTSFIEIFYPDPCPYKGPNEEGICPHGHKDEVISIVYGYPSKTLQEDASNGNVMLGGCVISYCDPYWYCKKHRLEF